MDERKLISRVLKSRGSTANADIFLTEFDSTLEMTPLQAFSTEKGKNMLSNQLAVAEQHRYWQNALKEEK